MSTTRVRYRRTVDYQAFLMHPCLPEPIGFETAFTNAIHKLCVYERATPMAATPPPVDFSLPAGPNKRFLIHEYLIGYQVLSQLDQ